MLLEDWLLDAGAKVVGPAKSVDEALSPIQVAAADGGLSAAVLDMNLEGVAVSLVADRSAALGVAFVFSNGYGEGCDRGVHSAAPVLAKPFGMGKFIAKVRDLAGTE